MIGVSIYLSQKIDEIENYLDQMAGYGIKSIFTSFHIKEENSKDSMDKITKLCEKVVKYKMDLMVDISTDTLLKHNMTLDEMMNFLKDNAINKVRIDYGFSVNEIKKISEQFEIVLNASTINDKYCDELESTGLDLNRITVCHNFYPRPETGLSSEFLLKKNNYFKSKGFKIQAFIPGDKEKRGPLKEGLPTIEKHRHENLLSSYIELKDELLVDQVLIGDISILEDSLKRILLYDKERIIELKMESFYKLDEDIKNIIFDIQKNREDYSELVLRSTMTRVKIKDSIKAFNNIERKTGYITLDNENYGRYNGELQIALVDLKSDERVNVIGKIHDEDIILLKFIKDDVRFRLIEN